MVKMTSHYAPCAGYEIHYTQWGEDNTDTIVMWHGLARTGRDFDVAAAHFADRYRIICPDTLGRGLSQWAQDDKDYGLETYAEIAVELMDHLKSDQVRWLGTSMGGALGIKLAAGALKGRISHLLLNDFGPEPAATSVERIIDYVGNPAEFATLYEFEAHLRTIYAPYGYQSDAQWLAMAEHSARRKDNGKITVHYDPRMIQQLVNYPTDYLMWDEYDALHVPTLLLRGANSDLVTPQLAKQMTQRGPKAQVVEVEGCGHAPALNVPEQLGIVENFFLTD
ncbi:MAG: alpha/beta hydrolase [Magnetovibrio sp.]|nr:alpha/beta hydrolase [Magnetovibrio sp.]